MTKEQRFTSILTDNFDACYVCGGRATDMHHVFHGADKALSERTGCMVPLCRSCHDRVHHTGGYLDRELKEDAQRAWLIRRRSKECLYIKSFGDNAIAIQGRPDEFAELQIINTSEIKEMIEWVSKVPCL